VRQRRGVRGREYAWANARRLQAALAKTGLHEILEQVDLDPLVAELPVDRASALFCVERDPEACHRSLVAERLAEECGVRVVHLLPDVVEPEP
jgi:uncharacterized protein (DUF488 family)